MPPTPRVCASDTTSARPQMPPTPNWCAPRVMLRSLLIWYWFCSHLALGGRPAAEREVRGHGQHEVSGHRRPLGDADLLGAEEPRARLVDAETVVGEADRVHHVRTDHQRIAEHDRVVPIVEAAARGAQQVRRDSVRTAPSGRGTCPCSGRRSCGWQCAGSRTAPRAACRAARSGRPIEPRRTGCPPPAAARRAAVRRRCSGRDRRSRRRNRRLATPDDSTG